MYDYSNKYLHKAQRWARRHMTERGALIYYENGAYTVYLLPASATRRYGAFICAMLP